MGGLFLVLGAVMGVAMLLGFAAKKYASDKFVAPDRAVVCSTKKQIALGLLGALICGAIFGSLDMVQEVMKAFPGEPIKVAVLTCLTFAPFTCISGIPGAACVIAAAKILEIQKIGSHKWTIAIAAVALVVLALRAPISFGTLNLIASAAVTAGIIGWFEKRRTLSPANVKA